MTHIRFFLRCIFQYFWSCLIVINTAAASWRAGLKKNMAWTPAPSQTTLGALARHHLVKPQSNRSRVIHTCELARSCAFIRLHTCTFSYSSHACIQMYTHSKHIDIHAYTYRCACTRAHTDKSELICKETNMRIRNATMHSVLTFIYLYMLVYIRTLVN